MLLGHGIFIPVPGRWEAGAWRGSRQASPRPRSHKCVAFLPLPPPARGTVDVDREDLLRDCVQAPGDPALVRGGSHVPGESVSLHGAPVPASGGLSDCEKGPRLCWKPPRESWSSCARRDLRQHPNELLSDLKKKKKNQVTSVPCEWNPWH